MLPIIAFLFSALLKFVGDFGERW